MEVAHVVGDLPQLVEVESAKQEFNFMLLKIRCPDGIVRDARMEVVETLGEQRHAAHLLRSVKQIRMTIDQGNVVRIARTWFNMHEASLAILASRGIDRNALVEWARGKSIWSHSNWPDYNSHSIDSDLSWQYGIPVLTLRWPADGSKNIKYKDGLLHLPILPDVIINAMNGDILDRFVQLDGMRGLGFVISHAELIYISYNHIPGEFPARVNVTIKGEVETISLI